jgi:hypothetical protein
MVWMREAGRWQVKKRVRRDVVRREVEGEKKRRSEK